MKIIYEIWCSPLRQEIYSQKFVSLGVVDWIDNDEIQGDYLNGDFWYDVFGEDYHETKGLWKVVIEIDTYFRSVYDWEGIPDCEVEYTTEVLFKSKCESFNELRCIWESLIEEHNSKGK